jgi:large subunit ribosomal protein L9
MKVILIDDVDRVGKAGEIVDVSDGFFRNFLSPQKKAMEANEGSMKQYEARKRAIDKQLAARKAEAEAKAGKLKDLSLGIKANVGDEGKLFGAVTTQDIYKALKSKGYEIERKQIEIDAPFKEVGTYPVTVRLHPEVEVVIQIVID